VVDDDVDIRNPSDIEWAMTTRLDPQTGVITIPACFGHGLNPSFPDYQGTKIAFDCTRPFPYTHDYDRAAYKQVSLDDYEITGDGR
jgi:2,5-furandicarboxylate decarboxylase 1